MSGDYEIRPLRTLEELRACVDFQEATWGAGFSERAPLSLLKVARRLGGVVAGAWDANGELAAFVFGVTGVEDGDVVHWSDMLAVRPELRDSGLGTRLKHYQRERVLELGVRRMYWTFDPLESKNAYLNFAKLGIVVREYVEDMYGQTDSPLHRGIGTDRFVALWRLDSPRVVGRLGGARPPGPEALDGVEPALDREAGESARPRPGDVRRVEHDVVSVAIPRDIQGLKDESPELAALWRRRTREALAGLLGRGYEARELVPGGSVSRYLLARHGRGDSGVT